MSSTALQKPSAVRTLEPIPSDEGLHEIERLRELLGIDDDQNIAYAELTINGEYEELIAVSGIRSPAGTVTLPEERLFDTFDVDFDRSADAEVKLLEEIARRLQRGAPTCAMIRLFSERPSCDSCEGVIVQFRAEFPEPDIQLVVSDGGR